VITIASSPFGSSGILRMPLTLVWTAEAISSLLESPALTLLRFFGKTISAALYSLSRCELSCSDSAERFRLRWSTATPMDRACFLLIPASFSSAKVKPRPCRSL